MFQPYHADAVNSFDIRLDIWHWEILMKTYYLNIKKNLFALSALLRCKESFLSETK